MSYLVGLMTIVTIASIALAKQDYPAITIKIANEIPDYLDQYPNATVTNVTSFVSENKFWRHFEFGKRSPGDDMLSVADNYDGIHLPSPQDVTIEFKYPSPKNRVIITAFNLSITESSNPANCYITSLDTRNSSVSVWIKAKATNNLGYHIIFYGYTSKALEYPSTEIQSASKIEDYLTLNPNSNVTRMNETKYDNGTTLYYVGERMGSDELVSIAYGNYSYPIVQDVALSLEYPQANGTGADITYAELLLTESMGANATAYVVSGGLRQNYINIWVQSHNTTKFYYSAEIYGYFF